MTSHCSTLASIARTGIRPVVSVYDDVLWKKEQHPVTIVKIGKGSVEVAFTTVEDDRDLVRIRSRNWKAEDEINGWFDRPTAENIYRWLIKTGEYKRVV